MLVYFNGNFVLKEEVKISPDDRGFLFADGAYEVVRAYAGRLFQADAHFRRMQRSLRELRIEGPDAETLRTIAETLMQANDLENGDVAIYMQVTRGAAPRAHAFPRPGTPPTVYASISPFQTPPEKLERGVSAILVPDIRWARCDIKAVALLPNVLANQQARENGAEEAVFVRDGALTEGSHSNFCAVFGGELVTYPRAHYILAGVTREVVLDLCRELGIPCSEFPIFASQVKDADEMMIVGTTVEVMPVVQLDGWPVGDGKPGPITRRLQQAFRALVHQR